MEMQNSIAVWSALILSTVESTGNSLLNGVFTIVWLVFALVVLYKEHN